MASKRGGKNRFVAELVGEDYGPCAFCHRTVNDEVGYGKLYSIGDIYCHYFCVLLSCCLVQKGEDEEGLLGFLYTDILAEVERSKKHKCSFCGVGGATLGCAVSQCRKQFHLPCGRQRNSLSLFYGTYKSFCEKHAPRQQIAESIMGNVRARQIASRKRERALKSCDSAALENGVPGECVCVICYEPVAGFPSPGTFWPPCCARDAWFHRTCLERMSLSAGVHYLKCPLCNDKDTFYRAVTQQGYYVPDRDAAWELENAFADIYSRPVTCTAAHCTCPNGREHDMENGPWDIKLCLLCGGAGSHLACLPAESRYWVCETCQPATPSDLRDLEQKIAALIREEEEAAARALNSRPLMPSRMSIRRTKTLANAQDRASTSRAQTSSPMVHRLESTGQGPQTTEVKTDVVSSRLELNLKSPKKPFRIIDHNNIAGIESKLLSPIKYLEERLSERLGSLEVKVDPRQLVDRLKVKFSKPRPLCAKKKIINAILNELLSAVSPTRLRICSPGKHNGQLETTQEIRADKSTTSPRKEITTPQKDTTLTPNKNTETPPNEDNQTPPNEDNQTPPNEDNPTPPNEDGNKTPTDSNTNSNEVPATPKVIDRLEFESPSANDDSSNSTFQLPSEFIAESDDSLPILDTPKKSTTVEIQKNSSLEISEDNEAVNIDVVKIESSTSVISPEVLKNLLVLSPLKNRSKFAYIPCNKEADYKTVGIDLEDFKNQYLNELERKHECEFNHKHGDLDTRNVKFKTAIDFAVDAVFKKTDDLNVDAVLENTDDLNVDAVLIKTDDLNEPVIKEAELKENSNEKEPRVSKKRKAIDKKSQNGKKRKISKRKKDKYSLKYKNHENSVQIKFVYNSPSKETSENRIDLTIASNSNASTEKNIDLTIESNSPPPKKTKKMKKKTKNSKELKVKIKFKSESFKKRKEKMKNMRMLKLKPKTETPVNMKQMILKFSPDYTTPKDMIVKPESDVTPMKRKYVRHEKMADSFKQMSIHSFFKVKVPDSQ